jgi:hypothetical protein
MTALESSTKPCLLNTLAAKAALDDFRNWIVSTLLELHACVLSAGFCHRSALFTIVSVMSRESLAASS